MLEGAGRCKSQLVGAERCKRGQQEGAEGCRPVQKVTEVFAGGRRSECRNVQERAVRVVYSSTVQLHIGGQNSNYGHRVVHLQGSSKQEQ